MTRRIVRDENCGGRARILGTAIAVCEVVQMINAGSTLEQLSEAFPDLTMRDIPVIEDYYKNKKVEIDDDIAAGDTDDE